MVRLAHPSLLCSHAQMSWRHVSIAELWRLICLDAGLSAYLRKIGIPLASAAECLTCIAEESQAIFPLHVGVSQELQGPAQPWTLFFNDVAWPVAACCFCVCCFQHVVVCHYLRTSDVSSIVAGHAYPYPSFAHQSCRHCECWLPAFNIRRWLCVGRPQEQPPHQTARTLTPEQDTRTHQLDLIVSLPFPHTLLYKRASSSNAVAAGHCSYQKEGLSAGRWVFWTPARFRGRDCFQHSSTCCRDELCTPQMGVANGGRRCGLGARGAQTTPMC